MRTTHAFMPAFLSTFIVFTSAACSSSSSSGGATVTDTGTTAPDTAVGKDTGTTPVDTGTGDTKVATDAKADSKPPTDTAPPPPDCDPIKQTGCSGATSKCTAVDDGSGTSTTPGCMKAGTAAVDAPCTRTSETPAGIGDDTCAPGSYCSGIGSLTSPPTRHCRKFCADDKGCGTGQKCSILIADSGGTALYGICVPTCTLFGTDCPSGQNCSVLIGDMDGTALYGTCRAAGTVAAGASCAAATDCANDLVCNDPKSTGADSCNALCDTAHACTGGKTCTPAGSLPLGGGICE